MIESTRRDVEVDEKLKILEIIRQAWDKISRQLKGPHKQKLCELWAHAFEDISWEIDGVHFIDSLAFYISKQSLMSDEVWHIFDLKHHIVLCWSNSSKVSYTSRQRKKIASGRDVSLLCERSSWRVFQHTKGNNSKCEARLQSWSETTWFRPPWLLCIDLRRGQPAWMSFMIRINSTQRWVFSLLVQPPPPSL